MKDTGPKVKRGTRRAARRASWAGVSSGKTFHEYRYVVEQKMSPEMYARVRGELA